MKVPRQLLLLAVFVVLLIPAVSSAQPPAEAPYRPGHRLIVGVLNDPPYLIKEKDGEWGGLNADIWKSVAQKLHLDYEYREMNFEELFDAVRDKKIDIGIDAFFVLADREKVTFKLTMNIQNWFENPHVYDHNHWGGAIMQKQPAMQMAKENGWNVFSIRRL